MMKTFIHEDFLIQNETGRRLFHTVANQQPVIDYHNHLPPADIADDMIYDNLFQIWLAGDHYKWRAMRTCGVDERLITGDASDKEKFLAWAKTVPKTLKNPLYHWTHMELADPFGITDKLLNGESAEEIWEECNDMLSKPDFSARSLLSRRNVEVVATTDDPTDSLEHHQQFSEEEGTPFLMVPTFRPDKGMQVENGPAFISWIRKLEESSGINVSNFQGLLDALQQRHDAFHEMGCRASDHGINKPFSEPFTDNQADEILKKALAGKTVTEKESAIFKSSFLHYCALMNNEKGWVFQLHIGALRNNNSRMMKKLGPDSGFDSIDDVVIAKPLATFLDRLDALDSLPKTVLYNLNPRDNELLATMLGNFQDGTVPGKLQHGPPWWFLDQKDGIEKQAESLANMGILSEFIGMTTDSRSFLSFSRHEYFRRIMCNIIGDDVEKGLVPNDEQLLSELVEKICYRNARDYFKYGQY